VDIGLLTDEKGRQEYFDNTAGIGFDAVVTIRSHKLPIVKGFLMYLTAVLQTIALNHEPARVTYTTESAEWEETTLMTTVCNGPREGGGFLLAPEAKNNDGVMEFLTIQNMSRPMMLRMLPEFIKGTHVGWKQVKMGQCTRFNMRANRPLYIHLDGEVYTSFGSNLREIKFEILPGALSVVGNQ
jgi:diacylglycerol kinase (ATP)